MKSFFRFVIGCIKWVCLLIGLFCVLLIGFAFVLAFAGRKASPLKDKSILVFDLGSGITDKPATDSTAKLIHKLMGDEPDTISLRAVTDTLRAAATDGRIKAVYIHGHMQPAGYESGYAALKEVREALLDFHKQGKPIIAYVVDPTQRDLYLASTADQLLLNPSGFVEFHGLAASGMFFKGVGDKYGIQFQPIRHGKYKSAIEPFLRQDFSPENREQLIALFDPIWSEIVSAIAQSRGITTASLQALADNDGVFRAPKALASGLVSSLAYESEALAKLRSLTGVKDAATPIPQITVGSYSELLRRAEAFAHLGKNQIAIVYAEGMILNGSATGTQTENIYGDSFAKMLRKVQADPKIKAVVLRINSPGGSATASDVILDELRRMEKAHPLVISMGTVAASGGYWIATAADKIFAEPNTITGSIGVFGLGMNIQKLANDHGLTFDVVKTAPYADSGTISRPMTDAEQLKIQNLIDGIYVDFLKNVGANRKMTTNHVDELAQGRVWSGADAIKQGLVDELGGLGAATKEAAKLAHLADYTIVEYPKSQSTFASIVSGITQQREASASANPNLAARFTQELARELNFLTQFNDPANAYTRLPLDLTLP